MLSIQALCLLTIPLFIQNCKGSCPSGFYTDLSIPEGDPCSPLKSVGESCRNTTECNQSRLLECISGICQCNPTTSVFEPAAPNNNNNKPNSGLCVGRVGTKCSNDKPCIASAVCKDATSGGSGGTCACRAEFTPTADRLCGRGFQGVCSDTQACRDGLVCIRSPMWTYSSMAMGMAMSKTGGQNPKGHKNKPNNADARSSVNASSPGVFPAIQSITTGTCQCSPKYETFDPMTKTCRALVGAYCDNATLSCVERATCMSDAKGAPAACMCRDGFVETPEGKCEVEFGKPCTGQTGTGTCDGMAQLVCRKGMCGCQNVRDTYDPKKRRCVGSAGVRCQVDDDCLTGTICVRANNGVSRNWLWGRCGTQGKAE
jgi:hypothetical protein